MTNSADRAIAIVGVGAILPDAPSAAAFWQNIVNKRYSITDVPSKRWSASTYFDPDPKAPDKTYSKIGGWVQDFEFDWKRFRIPPKVAAAMDEGQQWAVTICAEALTDYGYPERPLNTERTAVIFGTAMGGEMHYVTNQRVVFPEFVHSLKATPEFQQLPGSTRDALLNQWHDNVDKQFPQISEDTMPGELSNIVSGRVANVLNLRGPNYITDAACASSFAAIESACQLLTEHKVDAALTGGVDHNMNVSSFVKFCKIGALSATGTRPFGDGADGFVMGEGAGAFLLKRLDDAERAGDKIYAVIRGVGGSSDGKGKGITAPNPVGQELAIRRAWESAGLDPATATLVEAHGTSTRVGDVVELESLNKIFGTAPKNSIGLGSAKSNIGHLKAGAGAAGMLKATYALHHKILPPTLNAEKPNPNIDFSNSPFQLVHDPREWKKQNGTPRRCGVSAYGFGGTNFHLVLEEHVPGMLTNKQQQDDKVTIRQGDKVNGISVTRSPGHPVTPSPVRGILALGANNPTELKDKLDRTLTRVQTGWTPQTEVPKTAVLQATERLIIDFADHDELLDRIQKAQKLMGFDNDKAWKAVQAQGIFRGRGKPTGKVAFLFPGQGSQYPNMGRELAEKYPVVADVFAAADKIMTPILGKPLTDYIFVDTSDQAAMMQAQLDLMQTEITQPAMLTMDIAMLKLLDQFGFKPDMVMGHSLGEYAALIAAGIMPFAHALEAAAARGGEMSKVSWDDNGWMAAVLAPYDVIIETLNEIDGYVVPANINSRTQCVIGGASKAVEQAIKLFQDKGYRAMQLPVSHAFHTKIVAPASGPLRQVLDRLDIQPPKLPLVANLTGELYPTGVEEIKDVLQLQVASPVEWVKGLETLYDNNIRTFVEVGPKRALRGFANDVFAENSDVLALMTNHPKQGELPTFNQALCGLYAAGYGIQQSTINGKQSTENGIQSSVFSPQSSVPNPQPPVSNLQSPISNLQSPVTDMQALGQMFMQMMQQSTINNQQSAINNQQRPFDRNDTPLGSVIISGTGLGLPGAEKSVMDPDNALRILKGEQFIDLIPERFRQQMVNKRITRLVKSTSGDGSFQTIDDPNLVIKLAGRPGSFNLTEEYGVPEKLVQALDTTTQLAMAAGLDALREAGIPLVMTYKHTTTNKFLPEKWMLPEALRDETGVIFASAFPGGARFAEDFENYYTYQNRLDQLNTLEDLRRYTQDNSTLIEINRRINELRDTLEREPYVFDRRFIFRILAMGHSQFAEYIGARGPNTHVNAACASTTQGVALAEDWIRSGRCRRVIVIGADNVTGDHLMEWVGSGFLALGASATDDQVAEAALPFDKRRHGTILGMGACALVIESEDAVRERGMRGIVELLSSESRNSAFHGSRLDVNHISMVMNDLVTSAERRFGLNRQAIAQQLVFMSHETFTPARGGSASAEVIALRETFGDAASDIVVANTKGFTGHPMGVGVEDVIALKILEYGIVPPVPNYKEVDPELGKLNLSRGGRYPVQFALHLAAGFGSQIAFSFTRRIPGSLDRMDNKPQYQKWLDDISGYDFAETEVVKRVLRIMANGSPTRRPVANQWRYGTGPVVRTATSTSLSAGVSTPVPTTMPTAPITMPDFAPAPEPVKLTPPPPPPAREPAEVRQHAPVVEEKTAVVSEKEAVSNQQVAENKKQKTENRKQKTVAPPPPTDDIADKVLAIVAEATGYPMDMLDLDLDLEADLGIDTVKQAETFAAIRSTFEIPARNDLNLREYNTLELVIGFVKDSRPELAVSSQQSAENKKQKTENKKQKTVAPPPPTDDIADKVLSIVAEATGYPIDMLDLDLDLEADLGIDTVKQAETFAAIRSTFEIPARDDLNLREYNTLELVIGFVKDSRPELAVSSQKSAVNSQQSAVSQSPASSPQSPVSSPQSSTDEIADKVLALVAAQTGYPIDMLELDLDLEADLGIDTVKQAETFAAIRQTFDIPLRDDLNLREYNTLELVIGFVKDSRPELAVSSQQSAVSQSPVSSPQSSTDEIADKVLALVAAQTGYPIDMLELDLDLEADLGIDTVKQAETFAAIRQTFDIPLRDDLNLREYNTLELVIGFVKDSRPELVESSQQSAVSSQPEDSPQSPVSSPQSSTDEIADKVLALVADQTGYPIDMLELDLDLEADLGIDTVKQAETFAAIRQTFDIPLRDDLNLREYNTLELVIGFVKDSRPELVESSQQSAVSSQPEDSPHSSVLSPQSSTDEIADTVLSIVAAQTGYPIDMLELDLDLEADLGIDTVKQAETFAAIRQTFDIPLRDDLNLREYNTLELVIGFVKDSRPELGGNKEQKTENGKRKTEEPSLQRSMTTSTLEDADKMPRRVPVPQLRPSLSLCKPTGITLDENSRVIVAMDSGGVGKALVSRLEKLKVAVLTLDATLADNALTEQLNTWLADGPVSGVYWLTALDVEPAVGEMTLETWREANRVRVKNLSITMRVLYDVVNEAGNFLVSATRLGGLHGYGSDGATAPLGGAVSGFTKAYKRERGDVLVKVVDFEVGRKTAVPADILIAETLTDPGIVEVGLYENNRYSVTINEQPAIDGQPGLTLDKNTVFMVTGAAGGITSAIVNDLAAASGGIFYLLDLVEAPAASDVQVQLFRSDKEALKKQLIDTAKAAGERPTPVYIEKQMMAIERQEAALSAIEAVEAASGTAVYRSANLLDGPAITAIVDEVRNEYGSIDVLVHAGGIEISKALNQKETSQFDLVYDIKADGFFSILSAAKEMPIGATVCFSSVAGRFGNSGQTDYSAANDLLCKLTSSFRKTRPDTKGIVIDWTAWGGIGMATRGSIPKIMEMAGIEMLPPESGIPTVRRELVAGGFKGEIVVGGALGMMVDEWDETGGLDAEKVAAHLAEQKMLMVGEVTAAKLYGGLQVETTLDPKVQPFLFDHAPDENTPWLPGVMATETMAQVAAALVPGYHVAAVENEEMSGAFKFFRNEPRTLHLTAIIQPANNGELVAQTTLRSITQPTREGLPVREQEHFSANVRLQADALAQPTIEFEPPAADTMPILLDTIYETFFHGPAYQVIERAGMEGDTAVCLMPANMIPNTEPADAVSLMAPRLVELCFQAAALWTQEVKQAMGFPLGIGSVTAYQQPAAAAGKRLYALLNTPDDGETFDAQVVDEAGNVFVDLKGYRTVSRPM